MKGSFGPKRIETYRLRTTALDGNNKPRFLCARIWKDRYRSTRESLTWKDLVTRPHAAAKEAGKQSLVGSPVAGGDLERQGAASDLNNSRMGRTVERTREPMPRQPEEE